jgi:predicted Kef-type K+ transport protein
MTLEFPSNILIPTLAQDSVEGVLLLWIGLAFGCGYLLSLVGLPPLVGYLIAGYTLAAIGQHPNALVESTSELGILLLLFTVGLKLKPRTLFKREVLGVGLLHVLMVASLSGLIFLVQNQEIKGGLYLGVALAFSSTVLAVKVLDDNGEISNFQGRTVLGILIFQDILAVGMMMLVGSGAPSPWSLLFLFVPLLAPIFAKLWETIRNDELRLVGGVLLAMAGGQVAHQLGFSPELGALIIGLLLSNHPEGEDLAKKLWSLKELFLISFFLKIGLEGLPNLEQIRKATWLLSFLPLQTLLFFALMIFTGLRARTSFVAALSLTTYSEFSLIVAGPLVEMGLLEESWIPILAIAVASSLALGALLNRNPQALFNPLEKYLKPFERKIPHPDQIPPSFGGAEWLVVGVGRTGQSAYRALQQLNQKVVGIDADPVRVQQLRLQDLVVVYGDVEDPALWSQASLDSLQGIMVLLPNFKARCRAVSYIRQQGFKGRVGTVFYREDEDQILEELGASVVYHPLREAGAELAERIIKIDRHEFPESVHTIKNDP